MSLPTFFHVFVFFSLTRSGSSSDQRTASSLLSSDATRSLLSGRKLFPGTASEPKRSALGSSSGMVSVNDFGALGDGSSDDTEVVLSSSNISSLSKETHLFSSLTLVINAGLRGGMENSLFIVGARYDARP